MPATVVVLPATALLDGGGETLVEWAARSVKSRVVVSRNAGLRFAFYGRVSTEDHQDPVTSRARQRDQASVLVAGFGQTVAEYFDVGHSRVLPWVRRPEAAALVRLVDAGPHPNRAHAAWGRRAWRLAPDLDTAPIVTWMFAQRRAGHSLARITRALNDANVPCPSAADPERNAHRSGVGWTLTTVRAILCNPRYTGRQVWNRQPSEHELIDPGNTGLGHRQVQRWNLPDGWVISARPAHPAPVSEADFIALQGMRAVADGTRSERCYLLAGLLRCGICGRRLESCWANNRAAYRCRHGHSSASRPDPDRPKNLYIRQDRILPHLSALYVLLAGPDLVDWPTSALPLGVADIIGRLRADRITLVYDPETRALRADTREEVKVILDPAR